MLSGSVYYTEIDELKDAETVNQWVSQRTNGKIKRLLEQISADTRLVHDPFLKIRKCELNWNWSWSEIKHYFSPIDKSSRGVSRIDEATPWDACPYA